MLVDLRSDTFTKPTQEMLQAMWRAEVGDDVFKEDPTVTQLEQVAAERFGFEAGLFCPSGTMTNQIALKVHTQPGDEIICSNLAHIYWYEGGGMAFNSGCQARPVGNERGLMDAAAVAASINNPADVHAAPTSLLAVENTVNKGGGSCHTRQQLVELGAVARTHNLGYHLDGARVFNALVATGDSGANYGQLFDSVSICLSKGLGCPVGSVLLGSKDFIAHAHRVRKRFGGGMRQAGYLAAAGLYALDHHISRLHEDHHRAKALADALEELPYVKQVLPAETNIVIFELQPAVNSGHFQQHMKDQGILFIGMGQGKWRFVTHLDVNDAGITHTVAALRSYSV